MLFHVRTDRTPSACCAHGGEKELRWPHSRLKSGKLRVPNRDRPEFLHPRTPSQAPNGEMRRAGCRGTHDK